MARRPRLFAAGVLYHVIVRGNQRQKIFTSDGDYQAFIERLARYRKKYNYVLHAYCLMPNHVHLLVESSEQPLAKFMQGLNNLTANISILDIARPDTCLQGATKQSFARKTSISFS